MKYIRGCKITQKEIADDFYEAYRRCFESKNSKLDEYGRKAYEIVSIPGFVNGLFACELYFKCLLGDKIKDLMNNADKHSLRVLYDLLDDKYKEELKSIKCDSRYTLEDLLNKIGNGFIMWRYIFEDGNEKFGDGRPFEYSEYFLKTYLPMLKELCYKDNL